MFREAAIASGVDLAESLLLSGKFPRMGLVRPSDLLLFAVKVPITGVTLNVGIVEVATRRLK